jgi:DNA-binding winged helix-turn-helix (wHTH) protein
MRYRFGEFTLSPRRRSLRRQGREVALIPRYFDLLVLLVERRRDALHRHEIFDRVWSDVVVSDGALTQAVRTLRRTLGEDGGAGTFIRTVSRHGYQFVHAVEEDAEPAETIPETDAQAAASETAEPGDAFEARLRRLCDETASDGACRETAEELHALGTAEALRRLDRRPGHARAWAYLRDSRWDVAGAGLVPLSDAAAGPAAALALVRLRTARALRLAGERWARACGGGAAAGAVAGLLGAVAMTGLQGSLPTASLLTSLALAAAVVAGVGAAGVGFGMAAAEAVLRSWRLPSLVLLGAAGGGTVAALSRRGLDAAIEGLLGLAPVPVAGAVEGLIMGGAAGLAYGLLTPRPEGGMATPRGAARLRAGLGVAVACAFVAAVLSTLGYHLGASSLDAVVRTFPSTQVRLDAFGPLFGEPGFGARTRVALGSVEGLLFGAGLAMGLTHRPEPRPPAEA